MNDLSVVIPYSEDIKDKRRDDLFEFVSNWWLHYLPGCHLISASGYNKDGSFNRAKARNNAIKKVKTRYVLIADADTICPPFSIVQSFDYIDSQIPYASWVLPYAKNSYYNLTKKCTDLILSKGFQVPLPNEKSLEHEHKLESWAGLLCMTASAFEKVGGYDENFIGWGYEDNAFRLAMDTLWSRHVRINSYCVHLWHEAPEEERFSQPNIQHNRRLYEKYAAAYGHRLAMQNLKGI